MTIEPEIYYWKPRQEETEVDFVLRSGTKVVGIEVKSSSEVGFKDTKSIRDFLKNHPEAEKGIIVYSGTKVFPVATNIFAVPWQIM